MSKIYQGTVGLVITLDVGIDVTNATVLEIGVRTPSGAVVSWPGTPADAKSGANHGARYTTQSGDLDDAGVYRLQTDIEIDGWRGPGDTAELLIHPRFA